MMAKSNTTSDASTEPETQDEPTLTENSAVVQTGTTTSEMFYRVEGHLTVDDGHEHPRWEERTEEWEKPVPEDTTTTTANLIAIREGLETARQLGFVNVGVSTDSMQAKSLLEEDVSATHSENEELVKEVNDLRKQFNGPTVVTWFPQQLIDQLIQERR